MDRAIMAKLLSIKVGCDTITEKQKSRKHTMEAIDDKTEWQSTSLNETSHSRFLMNVDMIGDFGLKVPKFG